MCGIFGKIPVRSGQSARNGEEKERFEAASRSLVHRGPDDSGLLFDESFAFGHRRLSILDPTPRAHQPMTTEDGMVSLTYNGEIYNFEELRPELEARGYRFRTSSDTEVLLNGIHCHGISFVERCIGMFAFAVFDKRTGRGFLVRDRLGIKPLYFHSGAEGVTFASEAKAIFHLIDLPRTLNLNAVSSYFSYRYPILNDTFFDGIASLAPGTYLEIGDSIVRHVTYWNPAGLIARQADDLGEAHYRNETRELLDSAVRYRMKSDVPFGAFLSGGVDSSVITALMAGTSKGPVKTFSVGFEEQGYNEFPYARLVADRYKTDHHEMLLSCPDYITEMERVIAFKDAPLAVPNEVPIYLLSKKLKESITVVLSGEGADEAFGGYGRIFRSPHDLERYRALAAGSGLGAKEKGFLDRLLAACPATAYGSELGHFLHHYSYTPFDMKARLLSIDVPRIEESLTARFADCFEETRDASYTNKMLYAFTKIHLVGLLHRLDTCTMAASVEARVPFVDHRIVEFCLSLPESYKLRWKSERDRKASAFLMGDEISERHDTPKYLLKKSFARKVPKEITARRKLGFPVPLNDWLGGGFMGFARDVLLDPKTRERGVLNVTEVERMLNEPDLAADHGKAMKVWMMINLELFQRQLIDG